MTINVSVQYTVRWVSPRHHTVDPRLTYYHRGTHLKCHEEVLPMQPMKQQIYTRTVESPYGNVYLFTSLHFRSVSDVLYYKPLLYDRGAMALLLYRYIIINLFNYVLQCFCFVFGGCSCVAVNISVTA